jgi:acetyl-CoA carboxylase beta subunit
MEKKTKREKEEQYFAEQELKKRKVLREKLSREREESKKEHLKDTHWMKCPKCGHDLEEKTYEDVMIDECDNCKGVWLDHGELELLLDGRKAKGFLAKFLSSV